MTFPQDLVDIRVRAFILGEWVDFGPAFTYVDDYFTEYFTDVFLGRSVIVPRRLPSQEVSIDWGLPDESASADPASVSIVLWNEDGHLTPQDPRSPYWPDWDLGCPLEVTIEGQTWMLEVSEIVTRFPEGDLSDVDIAELTDLGSVPEERFGFAHVVVTASGILRRLSQGARPLRSSFYRLAVKPANLARIYDYFPMEEGAEATEFRTGLPGVVRSPARWTGEIKPSSDSTLVGSAPLPSVSSGDSGSWSALIQGFNNTGVLEWVTRIPDAPTDEEGVTRLMEAWATGTADRWLVDIGNTLGTPYISVRTFTAGDQVGIVTFSNPPNLFIDDTVTMRLVLAENGANIEWSLRWSPITGDVDPVSGTNGVVTGKSLNRVYKIGQSVNVAPQGGVSFGHVIVHDGIPAGWLVPADAGFPGELAVARIRRLCVEENIPKITEVDPDAPSTSTALGPQRIDTLLGLLQEAAEADLGLLVEDHDTLALRYLSRRARSNRDPVITLHARSDQGLRPPLPSPRDDLSIRNDVEVSRDQGGSARSFDQVSIDRHGLYDESVTLTLHADKDTVDQANWRLHLGTYDGARFPQVEVDTALLSPARRALVLGVREGDRIRIDELPPQHPIWPAYADLIVYGGSHQANSASLVVSWNCGPAEPWELLEWQQSRWDSNSSRLTAAVSAVATSLSVSCQDAGLWTTAGAQFPFDAVLCDEDWNESEVVRVTNIVGASSPQTFTVTRNINSLARAHPSATRIRMAARDRIGL